VKGTHPLAGHYGSKQQFQANRPFLHATHSQLQLQRRHYAISSIVRILGGRFGEDQSEDQRPLLRVTSVLVDQDWAVIEMFADGAEAKEGWVFDNNYCWVCRFDRVDFSSKS